MSFFAEAMHSLNPDLVWKQEGDDPTTASEFNSRVSIQTGKDNSIALFEKSISTTDIKWNDISTKMQTLQAEYDAQEYARKRALEYPSIGDQMDMIYKDMKNGTTTHAEAVEVVKNKYPKG